jgi:hypothetical protein
MAAMRLAIPITQLFSTNLKPGTYNNNPAVTGGIIFCLQDLLEDRIDWR